MSAFVPAGLNLRVRRHFRERCAYCLTFEYLTSTHFEIEHINPRAAGGKTVFENLCLACPMCNRFKSDAVSALDPITDTIVSFISPSTSKLAAAFCSERRRIANCRIITNRTSYGCCLAHESTCDDPGEEIVDCDG